MFFISITKSEISNNFNSLKVEEKKCDTLYITTIVDKFHSDVIYEENGFSIIESPFVGSADIKKIILSNSTYNENNKELTITKSTESGKSIYYHINSKNEFYCSTHISLLRKAGVPIEENKKILPEFFTYRYVFPTSTLYKNIHHLFTGGELQIKAENEKCIVKSLKHYMPSIKNNQLRSIKYCSQKIYDELCTSIEKLSNSKKQIAPILSGGIDSSIITKICQNIFSINDTYSTGYPFENPDLNIEKEYALSAAEEIGAKHHYYEPSNDDYLKGFLESILIAEEPLHHLQTVLLHLLFKNAIPDNKNIIVHGQGAGFSFGNVTSYLYNRDKITTKILAKSHIKTILLKLGLRGETMVKNIDESATNYSLSSPNNPLWHWHDFESMNWVCNFFNISKEEIIKRRYHFIKKFEKFSIYDIWSLYSLLGDEDITLPLWTKLGEENKKTLYAPLYDINVINFVFSIPWKLKLKKLNILRKEIARQANIPEFIITRPKSSFGIQPEYWAKKGGIFEPIIPLASIVMNEKHIRSMQSHELKKAMTFWNMLNYSIWKRLFINNENIDILLEELNESM